MPQHRLTETDRRLLETLTVRLRVMTDQQLAEAFGPAVPRRLRRLERSGLVGLATLPVPVPVTEKPLVVWRPGSRAPRSGAVAWRLQKRWHDLPIQNQTVCWCTARAARLTGGVGGRLRQPLQVAHDLGVAAIYLKRIVAGQSTAAWLGEDVYRRDRRPDRSEKVPDAVELSPAGRITRAIEFGGAYPTDRIEAFHQYWSAQEIPYEIW